MRASASKTAQLEAKLDTIVSLLQSGETLGSLSADGVSSTIGGVLQGHTTEAGNGLISASPNQGLTLGDPPTAESTRSPTPLQDESTYIIQPEKATKFFNDFRTLHLDYLPFLHIPPHVTWQQLRRERPFLWLCIMGISVKTVAEREPFHKRIRILVYEKVIADSSPDIDILLGIIAFVSWATYSKHPCLSSFAHIITGIICDLGLNKEPPKEVALWQPFNHPAEPNPQCAAERTMEERRAVLASFLVTSSLALSKERVDSLHWTAHMEENLHVLEFAKECPGDELLVALVQIQLATDKFSRFHRDREMDPSTPFYTSTLQSELETVKQCIPLHLQQHKTVLLYLAHAELIIHETTILKYPSSPGAPDIHRVNSLFTSNRAAKLHLNLWLSLSPEEFTSVPVLIVFQTFRAAADLYKLFTLEDPAWENTVIQNNANMLEVLDYLILHMRRAAGNASAGPHESVFEKGIKLYAWTRQAWQVKLFGTSDTRELPDPASDVCLANLFLDGSVTPVTLPTDVIDDNWMMDVLNSF
ncbi:hypothetical protein FQN55_006374 [Onygenales sp. PD_40]|nr:hypothetical protein FQN55_006374 [Onygenales sp. PD_40]KAK2793693.1 hypothetical protein FQN52_000645 [Onygenales sp. PD_12]